MQCTHFNVGVKRALAVYSFHRWGKTRSCSALTASVLYNALVSCTYFRSVVKRARAVYLLQAWAEARSYRLLRSQHNTVLVLLGDLCVCMYMLTPQAVSLYTLLSGLAVRAGERQEVPQSGGTTTVVCPRQRAHLQSRGMCQQLNVLYFGCSDTNGSCF